MTPADLASRVVSWGDLRIAPGDDRLTSVCAAVAAYIDGLPVVADTTDGQWTPQVDLGATMLAARLHRRRMSPNGLETFGSGDMVTSTYVSRFDPDIAVMLRLDAPTVG